MTTISTSVRNHHLSQTPATKALRVCCYGSSSAATPEIYLQAARDVGYLLATREHVCVNGAGSFGCMAALNDGCAHGDGHIVGVIHEMFLVDNSDWMTDRISAAGPHRVFHPSQPSPSSSSSSSSVKKPGPAHKRQGPIREILIAGGKDLQERKKLLVEKADALVVLPGGPGTWDELWEMACARNIGLTNIPIVCLNVDGYYKPFQEILQRAAKDKLIKLQPQEIVHFADTAVEAIAWIEEQVAKNKATPVHIQKRDQVLKKSTSAFNIPPIRDISRHFSRLLSELLDTTSPQTPWVAAILLFGAGAMAGMAVSELRGRKA